eukprot:scaffold244684_cov29-Tisochrysis_lutea.AAC.4
MLSLSRARLVFCSRSSRAMSFSRSTLEYAVLLLPLQGQKRGRGRPSSILSISPQRGVFIRNTRAGRERA